MYRSFTLKPDKILLTDSVLAPSWWYKNAGITFDEVFFYQPIRRDEFPLCFTVSFDQDRELHQLVHETKLSKDTRERSPTGGMNWIIKDPDNFALDRGRIKKINQIINFTYPNFTLKINKSYCFYSNNRGLSWDGPSAYPYY